MNHQQEPEAEAPESKVRIAPKARQAVSSTGSGAAEP